MDDLIINKGVERKYTSTGRHSGYQVDLYHSGLDEHKYLSAVEYNVLKGKIHNQKISWNNRWDKELYKKDQQTKAESADALNKKAQERLSQIDNLLGHTILINDAIDWCTLKYEDDFDWHLLDINTEDYIALNPQNGYPESVHYLELKPTPRKDYYFHKISFFQTLLGNAKKIKLKQEETFKRDVETRKKENEEISRLNAERDAMLLKNRNLWHSEKAKFEDSQNRHNEKINELESLYNAKQEDAIVEYCDMVLSNSEYPKEFPKLFVINYNPTNNIIIVDYHLPSANDLPSIESVKYVKSKDSIVEKPLSKTNFSNLYDNTLYQVSLRTIHELFESDQVLALNSVVFNGFVTALNPATGHEETNCILSIQANKDEFEAINLQGIVANKSYKECFKALKGVGSAKLSTITPVKPILYINREDDRFVKHYNFADDLDQSINIAAMNWLDFENLIREIFEKEFSANGGEVRVTQASADGGVDAIAFDPDPIRGGKIVIQAKRYTNVVGVAAVRDLYGTVMNEGATKGILITTSDYGSDSYNFAKDKPLTLLNGSNLLHLLEKHGHSANIDVKAAKLLFKEQANR